MADNSDTVYRRTVTKRLEAKEVVLLDGGIGSVLYRRGVPKNEHFPFPWSTEGLVWDLWPVLDLHEDYMGAGCRVITANAFRTNRSALEAALVDRMRQFVDSEEGSLLGDALTRIGEQWGDMSSALTELAVFMAHGARRNAGMEKEVAIAGNLTTLADTYEPEAAPSEEDAYPRHKEKVNQIVSGLGVDLILAETMNTIDESKAAVRAGLESRLPTWISFVLHPRKRSKLYSGQRVSTAVEAMSEIEYGERRIDALLLNCARPEKMKAALVEALETRDRLGWNVAVGVYANVEKKDENNPSLWYRDKEITEGKYAEYALKWVEMGAGIIGGCCGTTPRDIARVAQALQVPSEAV